MIDQMLVKSDLLRYLHNVRAVRGIGRGLSDNSVLLSKVRLLGA